MTKKIVCSLIVVFMLGMFIGPAFAQLLDKGSSPESKEAPLEKREKEVETENKVTLKFSVGLVREEPSIDSTIKFKLKKGDIVSVIGIKGDWYLVKLGDGRTGWAHQSLFFETALNKPSENNQLMNLNYLDVDIRKALSALAMEREINIAMAKDVSGKISVHLYQVTLDEALEAITLAGGVSYHKRADLYYVYKPKEATDPQAERLQMRIFRLKYADVDKVQEVLAAIPGTRMIKVHEPSRTIIVEDTPENIEKIETIINYWDTMPKQRRIFRLKYADVDKVREILDEIPGKRMIKVHEPSRTITVEDTPENIKKIETIISYWDTMPKKQIQMRIFRLKYADVDKIREILGEIPGMRMIKVHEPSRTIIVEDTPENIKKIETIISYWDKIPKKQIQMRIFKLKYADVDKVQEVLVAIPGMRMIKAHEPSRTIIVEDTPENIQKIETIISYWDRMPKQVMIEAKILEISLTDDMSLGVNWEKILGDVRIGTGGLSTAVVPTAEGVSPVPGTGAGVFANIITGIGTRHQFAAALNALQAKTRVETLSTPKILAIHGKKASVQVGGKQGYKVTTVSEGVATETIEFIDTGTILEITPYIDDEGNVLLNVKPNIQSARIVEGIPVVTTTVVSTWLMAKSGETAFIGGLIQDTKTRTREMIPCLGSIPGLGALFGRTSRGTGKSELVILITSYILDAELKRMDQEAIEKTKKIEEDFKKEPPPPQKKEPLPPDKEMLDLR